jgi:hypothetical protein
MGVQAAMSRAVSSRLSWDRVRMVRFLFRVLSGFSLWVLSLGSLSGFSLWVVSAVDSPVDPLVDFLTLVLTSIHHKVWRGSMLRELREKMDPQIPQMFTDSTPSGWAVSVSGLYRFWRV